MGTVRDALRQLLSDRAAAVTRVAQIDREIADVRAAVAEPLTAPPAARATADKPTHAGRKAPVPSRQRHNHAASREQCRNDIIALLATGARAMQGVASALNWPKQVIRTELLELRAQGKVIRVGTIGRNVRWSLAPKGKRADEQFEPVWPLRSDPKAPPTALRGAQA